MNALVFRAAERHITAPLIGNYPVVHHATHDSQHLVVKEEAWGKARRFKGHWQKMAMRTAVPRAVPGFEKCQENRPKRASAGVDQGPRKMLSKYAIALLLDLDDLVLNRCHFAFPRSTSLANLASPNNSAGPTCPSATVTIFGSAWSCWCQPSPPTTPLGCVPAD